MERYFAELESNIVKQVIISEEKPDGNFVETFINSEKNYAGIGSVYLPEKENFISPKPYESWLLNENCIWVAPVPMPEEVMCEWDEEKKEWTTIKTI